MGISRIWLFIHEISALLMRHIITGKSTILARAGPQDVGRKNCFEMIAIVALSFFEINETQESA